MNKLVLVESVMAQEEEYRGARVIALKDHSQYLAETIEVIEVIVLLDDGRIINVCNIQDDDGKEVFILNRVDGYPFYHTSTWQDFLPNPDVLEWAQARHLA